MGAAAPCFGVVKNVGRGGVKIVHVSFSKWGWIVSWIVIWVVMAVGVKNPLRTNKEKKEAIFKRYAPL